MPDENPLICRCFRIHRREIQAAIGRGMTTVDALRDGIGASAGCGSCYEDVQAVLDLTLGRATAQRQAPAMSLSQMRILIFGAVDRHVKPLYKLNGVDVDILGVEPDRVLARLKGRGVGTTLPSILTLKWFMVRIMSDACGRKVGLVEMNIVDEETRRRTP